MLIKENDIGEVVLSTYGQSQTLRQETIMRTLFPRLQNP